MTGQHEVAQLAQTLRFDAQVPNHPASVVYVRRAVAAAAEVCGDETAEVVALVFTELVTNAILHAGLTTDDRIDVSLVISPDGLRGSVRDPGAGFELEGAPKPRTDGGFGLFIVAKLARTWGIERRSGGTEVWFEL